MWDLLVQQGLSKALVGKSKKPTAMTEWEWEDLDVKALSTIRLCLADKVLFNIVGEDTTSRLMEQVGKSIYDEVLDERNLLEETVVQFVDERRYKSC
jgi:hypothetical protein